MANSFITLQWGKGIRELEAYIKNAPRRATQATQSVLNFMVFHWRALALSTLASHVHVRDPRFDLSRLRYEKAPLVPINRMHAVVGSIFTMRGSKIVHDGWRSLETGGEPAASRTQTLLARGGNLSRKMLPSSRLKKGNEYPTTDDYRSTAPTSRLQWMLREAAAAGKKTVIVADSKSGVSAGVYKITRKKGHVLRGGQSAPQIKRLQRFKRKPKTARFPWLQISVDRLITHTDFSKLWAQAMDRITGRHS